MAKRRTGNSSEVRIGPWPRGIDNVHEATHAVFQVGRKDEFPRLRVATDVDLDDEGWPKARSSVQLTQAVTTPLGVWRVSGRTFVQDLFSVYELGGTALCYPAPSRVSICEHGGLIYCTAGGDASWEIDGDTVRNWGLGVPTVTLDTAAGGLPAGRYLVQVSYLDARGHEGGTSEIRAVVVDGSESIVVSWSAVPAAIYANIYVSSADQKHTHYHGFAVAASNTYQISAVDVPEEPVSAVPVTEQMSGPLNGAIGVFSFRAFLLIWRENAVFRSEALEPHLFHPDNFMQFPSDVRACAGLEGGMWIGTDDGLWWVAGEHPEAWVPARRSAVGVLPDCAVVDAAKLPAIQSAGLAALFVTTNGELVAGTGSGSVIPLTDGRYRVAADTRVSIAYVERDDLSQILIACQ